MTIAKTEREIVDVKCRNCGKDIFIFEGFVREKMFCTLKCLDEFKRSSQILNK